MSRVRVLVGTRKGAFILDVGRQARKVGRQRPAFRGLGDVSPQGIAGRSESHLRLANQRLVRADNSALRRRRQNLEQPGTPPGEAPAPGPPKAASNKFVYDASAETGKPLTTHQWYDGTQHPWEFKRVWHLEPSLTDPDTVYAGVEDAALFRSTDGGENWQELSGLRGHGTGPKWQPGAGGMCLHTIILDPSNPQRMFIAISAAGAFRTDDGGKTWKPINRGLSSQYIPDPTAEVGHCVHHIAMHPSRPGVLFMQKHWDVMRSDDAGDNWKEISGNLPTDFGFVIDVHAHEPETIYVVPIKSDSRALCARWQAARLPQPHGRQRVGGADERSAAEQLLRQRAARRDGRRLARRVRRVFRHHRRAGVRARPMPAIAGLRSCAIFRPCFRSRCRRCHDPRHAPAASANAGARRRRSDARSRGQVTQRSVLDALEARYPMLRGTIRDQVTQQRRPFLRFFACEEDLSHEPPDAPLPDAVASGKEPFIIIGAIAGG